MILCLKTMFLWLKKCFCGRMEPCKDHSVADRSPKLRDAWKVIQAPTELISILKIWIYVWMFCINAWRTYFSLLRSQKYIFKQQFERKFKLASHLGLNFSKNGWVVLENELFNVEENFLLEFSWNSPGIREESSEIFRNGLGVKVQILLHIFLQNPMIFQKFLHCNL